MTKRSRVKSSAAAATASGAEPVRAAGRADARQRVVIIGGGVAGVSLAWLLDGVHDVVLLESDAELGGHARTLDVTVDGRQAAVDAGAP